jgi:hypothetical protein
MPYPRVGWSANGNRFDPTRKILTPFSTFQMTILRSASRFLAAVSAALDREKLAMRNVLAVE